MPHQEASIKSSALEVSPISFAAVFIQDAGGHSHLLNSWPSLLSVIVAETGEG